MNNRNTETFEDWTITPEQITAPNGEHWTPAQLHAWQFDKQLLAELKLQLTIPYQYTF